MMADTTPIEPGTVSLAEAVNIAATCQNFFRHCAKLHEAGLTILQAQQNNEDLLARRDALTRDVERLQTQQQDLTREVEQGRRDYEAEKRRYEHGLSMLSQQQTQERADLGRVFDQWKADLEREQRDLTQQHAAAVRTMATERQAEEDALEAVRAELRQLRERIQGVAGPE